MEYTFNNVPDIVEKVNLSGYSCVVEDKPLPILQELFDEMKKEYIRARNVSTELFIEDYGEEEGKQIMNERYPKPVNIDELANQAKIIANKYELCETTLMGRNPGFIVKIPNIRVRVRTYCNLGDYYCWIQKFGIDKFILKIYQAMPNAEGFMIFGGAGYPHPHIAGDSPCLGSFESVIKNCAGHFNMVGVLSNIKTYLNSYYGRSVFLRHSEFRPVIRKIYPIEILKTYPAKYPSFTGYYDSMFKDKPELRPQINSNKYNELYDKWNITYHAHEESIELKPHECNFYIKYHPNARDANAMYEHVVLKVHLMTHKFDIPYFQAYSLLMTHGESLNGTPIKWGTKFNEYEDAWLEIKRLCIDHYDENFRIGFSAGSIYPDESLNSIGLVDKATELYKLLYPRQGEGVTRLIQMPCDMFWKYIDKYKDVEEFLIPQDNYDERKDECILMVDDIYPKLMEYKDAYSRKIIITLDKQKRRLQNGLKHTAPTPESNQLSFDTISQD